MARDAPLSDDELIRLIEAHAVATAAPLALDEDDAPPEPEGEPCPHCGESALDFDACTVCNGEGCLPRDDWQPGWADPCLTRCARCGNLVHAACTGVNETGNRVCCGPRMASEDDW